MFVSVVFRILDAKGPILSSAKQELVGSEEEEVEEVVEVKGFEVVEVNGFEVEEIEGNGESRFLGSPAGGAIFVSVSVS
jgi:hypothetical protein